MSEGILMLSCSGLGKETGDVSNRRETERERERDYTHMQNFGTIIKKLLYQNDLLLTVE